MKARTPRGSPVFPEINCAWVERDLDRLATRKETPFFVSDETKRILREEVFPYWRGRQVIDRIMEAVPDEQWRADERGVLYHYFRSRIDRAHQRRLRARSSTAGWTGIKADVARRLASLDRSDPASVPRAQFLESVAMVCDARRRLRAPLRAEARRLAAVEPDRGAPPRAAEDRRCLRAGARRAGAHVPRGAPVVLVRRTWA